MLSSTLRDKQRCVPRLVASVLHVDAPSWCACPDAVVKKGAVVEQGNHEQLMAANGSYAALVALQQAERAVEEDGGEEENGIKEPGVEGMGRLGSAGSAEVRQRLCENNAGLGD